jgi:hypothetical protein
LDFPWLGKCCALFLLDLYIYFGFPLAKLKWSSLLKLVRLPLQIPEDDRKAKVVKWPIVTTPKEVRGFLGLCGTVRIWIENYSKLVRPLT